MRSPPGALTLGVLALSISHEALGTALPAEPVDPVPWICGSALVLSFIADGVIVRELSLRGDVSPAWGVAGLSLGLVNVALASMLLIQTAASPVWSSLPAHAVYLQLGAVGVAVSLYGMAGGSSSEGVAVVPFATAGVGGAALAIRW